MFYKDGALFEAISIGNMWFLITTLVYFVSDDDCMKQDANEFI